MKIVLFVALLMILACTKSTIQVVPDSAGVAPAAAPPADAVPIVLVPPANAAVEAVLPADAPLPVSETPPTGS